MGRAMLRSQELTHPTMEEKVAIRQLSNLKWPYAEGAIAYEWNITTDKIEWFGIIAEQLGFASDEFMKTQGAWIENIHFEDRERIYSAIYRSIKMNRAFLESYRVWNKDGGLVYVRDLASTLRNEADTPYKWLGLIWLSDKPWNYE
jgi:PAS domain-containing protein